MDTFDEALALARNDRYPALAGAITTFASVSDTLKSSPGTLTTPAIRKALQGIVSTAPNHVSARLLLSIAEGRLPSQFSASGSLEAVDQAVAVVREATDTDLTATSSLDSGKVSASRTRLQRLRGMIDARVQPYVDAWITWATLADQIITRRSATPQMIEQLKSAGTRINAEAKKMEGNSEFMEEVLRYHKRIAAFLSQRSNTASSRKLPGTHHTLHLATQSLWSARANRRFERSATPIPQKTSPEPPSTERRRPRRRLTGNKQPPTTATSEAQPLPPPRHQKLQNLPRTQHALKPAIPPRQPSTS